MGEMSWIGGMTVVIRGRRDERLRDPVHLLGCDRRVEALAEHVRVGEEPAEVRVAPVVGRE